MIPAVAHNDVEPAEFIDPAPHGRVQRGVLGEASLAGDAETRRSSSLPSTTFRRPERSVLSVSAQFACSSR